MGAAGHSDDHSPSKDEECPDGYEFDSELEICSERNHCSSNPCGDNGSCVNENASYRCNCNPGFQFDGNTCHDIDECNEQVKLSKRARAKNVFHDKIERGFVT